MTRVATVEPRPETEPVDHCGSIAAAQLLGRLGSAQRAAFVLTQVLGLSYEEAARSLSVPIGTIRSRVARARSELLAEVERTLAV
jgi:RNA polymerase sigma-70 factor (ECF subfamily)